VLFEHDNLLVVAGPGMTDSFMVDEALPVLNDEKGISFTLMLESCCSYPSEQG
jgi:hypothetical protein